MSTPETAGPSPSHTAVDLSPETRRQKQVEREAGALTGEDAQDAEAGADKIVEGAQHKLSQGRKWFLLLVFSVAQVGMNRNRANSSTSTCAPTVASSSTPPESPTTSTSSICPQHGSL